MKRVIAVAGSARRDGNSDTVLDRALAGMRKARPDLQVEAIIPSEMQIEPCRSCNACWESGNCVIDDELQEMYPRFESADYIVVATPIYFTNVPGELKVLIDRFQCFWARTYLHENPPTPQGEGLLGCVGAMDNRRYYESVLSVVKTWLSTLNVRCTVSRFYSGLDAKGAILKREDYLNDAEKAGTELVRQ